MDEIQAQTNREARIIARRKRIQERLAALREGENAGGKEGEKKEEIGKGKQQVLESKRRLLRIKYRTDQEVSSVRVQGDDRENQHRIGEEQTKQDLRAKLLAEAEQSARQNAAVAMRWADLFSIEVPQDLYNEIEKQRQSCERIIASKDKLILEIKTELKKKDDEFVKALKRQAEDVDSILQYMSRQFVDMQNAFKEELDEIENSFLLERSTLLDSNRRELQDLFDRRSGMEQDFMDRYLAAVENYQQQLESLRISDAESHHVLKIRLETDIQNLEQHLEAMRATYQLNTEKLEYNYRVLIERDHENQATINQQKRKISRQRDVLSSLKQRYSDTEKKFVEENMRLTDEYKRVTEQFKDLQSKFRHFEAVDIRKYSDVWAMKEAEVATVVKQLLQADKTIHDQQLGWTWLAPDDAVFDSVHDQAAKPGGGSSSGGGGKSGSGKNGGGGKNGTTAAADEEIDEDTVAAQREEELQSRLRNHRYWGALGLLCDEAGFLVDSKARTMLEHLSKDDQGRVKAESIIRALGVSDGASLDALMGALGADSNIELRAKGVVATAAAAAAAAAAASTTGRLGGGGGGGSGGGGGGQDGDNTARGGGPPLAVLVHPDDAVKRLKAFVEVYSTGLPSQRVGGVSGPSRAVGLMRRAAEREQEFWLRMGNVISDKGTRVWKALEGHLEKYLELLQERAGGLRDVESLQHQNTELRALLNQYLGSRINEELQIPPTQII